MTTHANDVADLIREKLAAHDGGMIFDVAPSIAQARVNPAEGFPNRDGSWVTYALGDVRGFRITVEAISDEEYHDAVDALGEAR